MHRVLMVSPHFPPDTMAATHRVRLLAPHLPRYGWEPTVVTVDPRDYEGRLDPELTALVPPDVRVVRCRALSARWTRPLGVGDLGLRAFVGLYRTCSQLLQREPFEVVFLTIYPTYTALLGPLLKRRFMLPFVLDYQDPWVGAWGLTVGPASDSRPDLKSRVTRALARRLEPIAVRSADALTAVSQNTYQDVLARNPASHHIPCAAIPIGGEPADFEYLRTHARRNPYFDPGDGGIHLCYVGTVLPLGVETLRALLRAVVLLRDRRPDLCQRLRLHFFGTSNQTAALSPARVLPIARELGVDEYVTEHPPRIDYLDALTVLTQASAILMLGSSEPHYTASKLYPGLLARRPILAVYHEASSVVATLRRVARPPAARLVVYGDHGGAAAHIDTICDELEALLEAPSYDAAAVNIAGMDALSAPVLAGTLAALFDRVVRR
jgi:hypothetical protein